ncbi:hypothetical protein DRO53_02680 [Candidatus Bathyarchaeota archaeon]|nr:MAG: hypothetical protein DRO53_02680 [Candidatus Bathyarchaeota archaeon]
MNAYERVMEALLKGRSHVDRPPCINPTSTATVQLMEETGAYWPEAHWNPEKMARLASAAHRLAGLENVSLPFDITVEAEVLGAEVDFMEEPASRKVFIWPKVKKPVISGPENVHPPGEVREAGRIPKILEAIRLLKREFEGLTPVNVILTPPFTSLVQGLADPVKFLPLLVREPEKVKAILDALVEVFVEIALAYEEAGADIITLHDMGACVGMVSPEQFKIFVSPYLKKIVRAVKIPTILSICGYTLPIVEAMASTGATAIAVDEKTSMAEAKKAAGKVKPGYPVAGNISTTLLSVGSLREIADAVGKAYAEGADLIAPGCDFRLDTPTRKIQFFVESVKRLKGGFFPF